MNNAFDAAFLATIGHEGGYVNDPRDPGGETKFGISKRSYPAEDIPTLTLERAKSIYYKDFWGPAGCDALPLAVKAHVFDAAVNSGISAAIRMLQRAVHTIPDGILGPITLQAANSTDSIKLAVRFNAAALENYTELAKWPIFGKGWVRRVATRLKGI